MKTEPASRPVLDSWHPDDGGEWVDPASLPEGWTGRRWSADHPYAIAKAQELHAAAALLRRGTTTAPETEFEINAGMVLPERAN